MGAGNAPPKRVFTSVIPRPTSGSRKTWIVAGPHTASASIVRAARSINSASRTTVPLIDSPPRDSIIERGQAALRARRREHLDVEVGEREHGADRVLRADLCKRAHVRGVLD